ncbi:S8 family serine peptidase, partial [Planctomycetota bacterium]
DRDDDSPDNKTAFWYLDPNEPSELVDPNGGRWMRAIYDDVNDPNAPYDDGWDNGGYDTIPVISTSKNIMTVGAVDDINEMVDFSGWGPTDDGRIKPDIVANGFELYSPVAVNDVSYAAYSGTSQASASAAGSAALLVEYYDNLFGGAMRASTLKALIIHTAIDLGNPGPDYRYGWGLIDANEAAGYIREDFEDPNGEKIIEDILAQGTSNLYTFTLQDNSPFWATLCWTDPPGPGLEGMDNNTPNLINDLDLRIINNDDPNIIYYPYILDPNNPLANANTGDNVLDNVEQVYIASPNTGTYTAKISHKGTLTNSSQHYSLILSVPRPINYIFVDDNAPNDLVPMVPDEFVGGANSDPDEDGSSEHPFDSIQKAVNDAINGDIIIVRDGTYKGIGNYDINTKGLAVKISREKGPFVATIDCERKGRAFLFQSGETTTTVLDGLTLTNGYAEDPAWPQEPNETDTSAGYGGAIYCNNSSPTIKNCIIIDNLADYGGGAIFCHENSNAFISSCDISYNDCGSNIYYSFDPRDYDVNQPGGGIYCKNSSPIIEDCTISYNWADGTGGGIACIDSDAVIMNCNIIYNDCWADNNYILQHGGGIYCEGGRQIIQGCTIEWNYAAWSGGGIAVLGKDEVWDSNAVSCSTQVCDTNNAAWIDNCQINNNVCWASGGGIFGWRNDSLLIITNSLINNNWGYWSGGISSCNGSFERIENCTVVSNVASWKYTPYLIGGLECYYGGASIINSIFWDNSGVQIEGIKDVNDPNIITNLGVTYSDIQIKDANGVTTLEVWSGEGNINEEPLFAEPKNFDFHLQTEYPNGRWNPQTGVFELDDPDTSPCINAGDPSSDYLFEPTPNGSRVNMGAYGNTIQASKSN